jgi:hypothetical protein
VVPSFFTKKSKTKFISFKKILDIVNDKPSSMQNPNGWARDE